ncbi:terpenoid cyclases/Protein prenyltransferase [Eremomyces bilateralis CBS 781.70]|uniref:Protein farnesyltransferase subunit beta n=1 Tax=Eremomyces bilateralis CBS 781.70 TaxID=1392243 RepID=A0A6G1G684_9PEZI|nr:terpenoid cyclases/Protein prenyltransferase [Eremomyces bilateralis CBS 781.70]KAF1813573.1 terpenoid cyclases/Protein prenyltransferase [Eremomyces bilateralis CBS 781.70]
MLTTSVPPPPFSRLPPLPTFPPSISPEPLTPTLAAQKQVAELCLSQHEIAARAEPHRTFPFDRVAHAEFLAGALEKYPWQFQVQDASRPWLVYWAVAGLSALGEELEDVEDWRDGLVATFKPCQNLDGGFGGGYGQLSHLATSYAAVLSLIASEKEECYRMIDTRAMWHYLGRMKQPHGPFTMCAGGEVDVRGAFCALVIISLLGLPLELPQDAPARKSGCDNFLTNLGEWIGKCQTYEGGLGSSPGNEAHGAYTFCGLGSLCIMGTPSKTVKKFLDVDLITKWLSARQYAPEGGMAGRTNKLVDGCYSHWIGGCWPLMDAAMQDESPNSSKRDYWSREGLLRYIFNCCQEDGGGLRDKPGKRADAYHTNYNIAGLSWVQNKYSFSEPKDGEGVASGLAPAHGWDYKPVVDIPGLPDGRVNPHHPVYVIPWTAAAKAQAWFGANRAMAR